MINKADSPLINPRIVLFLAGIVLLGMISGPLQAADTSPTMWDKVFGSESKAADAEQNKAKPKKTKRLISRMPRVLCGREMSLEDYKSFIITGSTPPIADFKSKKGRPFAAALHLKDNGNFEFKFVSRKALLGEETVKTPKNTEKKSANKAKVVKKTKKKDSSSEGESSSV